MRLLFGSDPIHGRGSSVEQPQRVLTRSPTLGEDNLWILERLPRRKECVTHELGLMHENPGFFARLTPFMSNPGFPDELPASASVPGRSSALSSASVASALADCRPPFCSTRLDPGDSISLPLLKHMQYQKRTVSIVGLHNDLIRKISKNLTLRSAGWNHQRRLPQ
jgi:hypothetical protein